MPPAFQSFDKKKSIFLLTLPVWFQNVKIKKKQNPTFENQAIEPECSLQGQFLEH